MTVLVALSRPYPCRDGGPVLRQVERRIFVLRYFRDCMACGFCADACCAHGVDVDVENVARIRALPEDFRRRIAAPADAWFTADIVADAEFPGGAHVRTAVIDGACVFRSRAGRGCLLHSYALDSGMDYHAIKPLVSTLFPVTFEQGVLAAASEMAAGGFTCAGEGPTLYEGARNELLHYFGAGLVAELDRLAR
jgi:hypothetical protein